MEKSADNGGAFGALMTDLSKAFDCLHNDLSINSRAWRLWTLYKISEIISTIPSNQKIKG